MPAIQVIAGDRDITATHQGLQLSNVDPGGFEILQLNPQLLDGLQPGAPVWVRLGGEVVWNGRVNEPSQHDKAGRSDFGIAALGYGAALKDNPIRRIYVDRDLSRWGSPSTSRRLALVALSLNPVDASVLPDASSGQPSLLTEVTFDFTAAGRQINEPVYDARGIPIGSLYYAWQQVNCNVADANYHWAAFLGTSDLFTSVISSGELRAAGPSSGTVTATDALKTFAGLQMYYGAAVAGFDGVKSSVYWTVLAVYGAHGLTKRGTADFTQAQGFYTSDIVRDAATGCGFDLQIDDATGFVVLHSTYLDPTTREQIIDDQAKLAGGWHWGVWEPRSIFSTTPTLIFAAPPSDATCFVSRRECDELEAPKVRLDQLYDVASVTYRDAAGTTGYVTVTIANPLLASTGVGSRTLTLDAGISSAAGAQAYGTFALNLAFSSARGGGWAILPDTVGLPGGGRKPACLLKAGRDRIRIIDIPDAGPLTETDSRRYDTFRVRRVEPTIDEHGTPRTRIEFDGGADLLEVLGARLAIAQVLSGS